MSKDKVLPPEFLQKKLSTTDKNLVRDNLSAFLKTVKKDSNGQYPPTKLLLAKYVAYLGKKHKHWKGVDPLALSTGYDGVFYVYDTIRKKTTTLDEKDVTGTASPAKANAKASSPKDNKAEDKNQIKDKEFVAQVEATDPNHPGFDEKPVKYYRDLGSNSHSSFSSKHGVSSNSKRISKSNKSKASSTRVGKLAPVKDHFVQLLYQHDEDEITYIWFEHDFITGVTKKMAHSKKDYLKQ